MLALKDLAWFVEALGSLFVHYTRKTREIFGLGSDVAPSVVARSLGMKR